MTGPWRLGRRLHAASPVLVLAAMALLFVVLPAAAGHGFSTYNVFSAMQTFSTYGLLALALGLTMIAGEFDISTLGMFALGGMLAVKLGNEAPMLGVAAAVSAGVLAGLIQGGIIARLGINSMSVTLAGYFVLLGLTQTIGNDQTVSFDNVDVGLRLDDQILTIFSIHSLVVIAGFALAAALLGLTRLGRDVRAIGGDRRTSRVVGVRVDLVVVGVFVASGALAGLAGALNSYSLASALGNYGFPPLVFAATAALLGGVSIAGGQGGAAGIAAGALAISLLQATFGILASPGWVIDVVTGSLLTIAVLLTAPELADRLRGGRRLLSSAGRGRRAADPPGASS